PHQVDPDVPRFLANTGRPGLFLGNQVVESRLHGPPIIERGIEVAPEQPFAVAGRPTPEPAFVAVVEVPAVEDGVLVDGRGARSRWSGPVSGVGGARAALAGLRALRAGFVARLVQVAAPVPAVRHRVPTPAARRPAVRSAS